MADTGIIGRNRVVVAVILAAALLAASGLHPGAPPADTDAMLDVSVSIRTVSHVRTDTVGDSVWSPGSGSGFLVDASRCEVWTNFHVVRDAALIEVYPRGWKDSRGINAQLLLGSSRADLAILKMDTCDGMAPAQFGDSDALRAGDETYAVGNPLGNNPDSITRGIVSHTSRYGENGTTPYLQTDAAINPGNSGGALFNAAGQVIGINTAIAATRGGGNVGIGYAVPVNAAKRAARALLSGPASWGYAGLEGQLAALTRDEAELFNVPYGRNAVVLTATPSHAPARGVFEARDVIYALNHTPLEDANDLRRRIAALPVGSAAQFSVVRAGAHRRLSLRVAEGRRSAERGRAEHYPGHLGMTLEMWSGLDDERGRFDTPVITRVFNLGPAHQARISSTQKNIALQGAFSFGYLLDVHTVTGIVRAGRYQRIGSLEDLRQAVKAAHAAHTPVLLEIAQWTREDPRDAATELEFIRKRFHRVMPALPPRPRAEFIDEAEFVGPKAHWHKRDIEVQHWRPRLARGT